MPEYRSPIGAPEAAGSSPATPDSFAASQSSDWAALVRAEQIKAVLKPMPGAWVTTVIGGLLFAAVMSKEVPVGTLAVWLTTLYATVSYSLFLYFRYTRAAPPPEQANKWRTRCVIAAFLYASAWGSAGVVMFQPEFTAYQAFLVVGLFLVNILTIASGFAAFMPIVLVNTDPVLLERLVRNLVDNAFKYTAAGGVTLAAEPHELTVRISVRDTGAGIAAGERERIFEEFYQIGNPERDRSQGLGLGLAIVRRLAQLLGLHVELESEPGRGSTFAVTVPRALEGDAETRAPAAPVAATSRGLDGAQVLVIDDEPEVRTGMQTLLEHLGCRVAVCGSYVEAERLLNERALDVDVIVADLRLRQHENGIDTVRRLRARLGEEVPALLVSGDTAPERLREAQSSGLPLLHKPVSADKLMETMLALLRR